MFNFDFFFFEQSIHLEYHYVQEYDQAVINESFYHSTI